MNKIDPSGLAETLAFYDGTQPYLGEGHATAAVLRAAARKAGQPMSMGTDNGGFAGAIKKTQTMIDNRGGHLFDEAWIFDHPDEYGRQGIGNVGLDPFSVEWKEFCALTKPDATIYLYGCEVGKSEFQLQHLANEGQRKVVAWTGMNKSDAAGNRTPQGKMVERSPKAPPSGPKPPPRRKPNDV